MDENTPLLNHHPQQQHSSQNQLTEIISTEPLLQNPTTNDQKLTQPELAAWVIDVTLRGNPLIHRSGTPVKRSNRNAYLFFENTSPLRQFVIFLLVLLSFFELPAWCSPHRECRSPDGSDLFLSGLHYFSSTTATMINVILLSILIYFAVFDALRLPRADLHYSTNWHRFLLFSLVIDLCWCQLYGGYPPFRPAPFLRALLPVFYWDSLRECAFGVVAVVSPFCDVVTFLAIFTLVFGWVATLLYHDIPEADRYFGNFAVGLYTAFAAMTTADWPMQIMAIMDMSRESALLFLLFIVIAVFLLFNVLLAVVYNAYTDYIEELVVSKLYAHRKSLSLAFRILTENGRRCSLDNFKLVIEELRKNKRHADMDDQRIGHMFTALDSDGDGNLSRSEFLNIVDVLHLEFIVEMENISLMEKLSPQIYNTSTWQSIASYVRSSSFSYFIDGVMIFNVLVVIIESTMDLRNKDTPNSVLFFAAFECIFSVIYIMEMFLKVASQGFDRYWKDAGNRFDFAVTWLLLIGAAYTLIPFTENDKIVVRYLVLLRCLRLFTLLAGVPRFRRLVHVFSVLIPASVPLFTFMFLSLYIFSAAGTEFFGGLIYKSNPKLNPANFPLVEAFVENDFWLLNFNDMAAGWHTLFSTLIVAYITEVPEAIASASRLGDWTKLFFMLNFIVNVLIVSNCVVAFVVDLFVMEDEQAGELKLTELQSKYGSKRVKILQQRNTADQVYRTMFSERVQEVIENYESSDSE